MPHAVYTIPLADSSSFKVGVSTHPPQRIAMLSRYYDFDLSALKALRCPDRMAFQIESTLHNICASEQVVYNFDGGTEFFSMAVYPAITSILISMAELEGFALETFQIDPLSFSKVDETEQVLNSLSNSIRSKRISYNLTQQQLAQICGVSSGTIKGLEGSCRATSFMTLLKVLRALDLDDAITSLVTTPTSRKRARGASMG